MYQEITGEDAYQTPMRIYPAVHYTMGGLWVDYNLMSNIPGLFVIGEANFSDHGANRLGASALMQGLADGYFVLPNTLPNYLAGQMGKRPSPESPEFARNGKRCVPESRNCSTWTALDRLIRSIASLACFCGTNAECRVNGQGLREALQKNPRTARRILARGKSAGDGDEDFNQSLERAGRVADFLEFAELMCIDALERDESAEHIFAKNIKRPMARHCATMTTPPCSHGNFKVTISPRNCIANGCTLKPCI